MSTTYIGSNLRYLRKMAGLSQQGLAAQIGLNRGNIASYEKGAAEPSSTNLLKLIRFFQVDLVDFIEHDFSQTHPSMVRPTHAHHQPPSAPSQPTAALSPAQPYLQAMEEAMDNTAHILYGFKTYHQSRTQHLKQDNLEVHGLMLDFQRLLELAFDTISHNRTLIRRVQELESRLLVEKPSHPSEEIPTLPEERSTPPTPDYE